MAKQILGPNTKILVNGIDLSSHCSNVSVEDTADEVESTGFGETYREHLVGLKDAQITATFQQDYSGTSVNTVIGAMYYANTDGTVKVTPDTSSAGTTVYTLAPCKVYSFSPVSGAVGALNDMEVTFRNSGTAGLTQGTA